MEDVQALTPEHRGRWLVTSRGSAHVFDFDAGTYHRTPSAGRNVFVHDGSTMHLTRVERWPSVDATFFIWLDDPDFPDLLEYWRQSSPIRSIVSLPPAQVDADAGSSPAAHEAPPA